MISLLTGLRGVAASPMISLLTGLRGVAAAIMAALIWNTDPPVNTHTFSVCRIFEPNGPISSMDDRAVVALTLIVEVLILVAILFPWSWSWVDDVYRIDEGYLIKRKHDVLACLSGLYSFLLIVAELENQRSSFCNYDALYAMNKNAYYGYIVFIVIPIWTVKISIAFVIIVVSVAAFVGFHIKASLWLLGSQQVPDDDGAARAA